VFAAIIEEPWVLALVVAVQPSPRPVVFPVLLGRGGVTHSVQLLAWRPMIPIVGVLLPTSRVAATVASKAEATATAETGTASGSDAADYLSCREREIRS